MLALHTPASLLLLQLLPLTYVCCYYASAIVTVVLHPFYKTNITGVVHLKLVGCARHQ